MCWFSDLFRSLNNNAQHDLFYLFHPVRSIIISEEAHVNGGAMYLDYNNSIVISPSWLYLNDAEKLNSGYQAVANDQRDSFIKQYSFSYHDSECSDVDCALHFDRSHMDIGHLRMYFAIVLYHELTHAMDCVPASAFGDKNQPVITAGEKNYFTIFTPTFVRTFPRLNMDATLIRVMFESLDNLNEIDVNQSVRNITSANFINSFSKSDAPTLYALNSDQDYLAEAFAHFMVAFRLNISTRVVVTTSDGKTLLWGEKNRELNPSVLTAGKAAAKLLMPQLGDAIDNFSIEGNQADNNSGTSKI